MFGKLIPKQNPDEERNTAKRTRRKRWYKVVCSMAAVVVVCTVYTLMLPALTLDQDSAADAGVTVEQSHDTSSSADTGSGTGDKTADSTAAESSDSSSSSESSESADNGDSAVTDGTPSDTGSDAGGSTSGADSDTPSDTDGTGSDSAKSDADSTGADDPADTGSSDSGTAAKADAGDSSKSSDSSSDASLSGDEPVSDDTADVETASDWEATFSELLGSDEWTDMTWGEKLAAMAATQLGYTESTKNFRVSSDGDLKGYTRYGDWYGNAYGDWCAMFVSFCLNYSDIDSDIVPQNANCASWVEELEETGLYFTADTEYVPEVGDVVFFDRTGSGKSDHVGIISDVELGEKEVTKHITSDGTAVEDSAKALVSYIKSGLSSLLSSSAAQTADLADTDTGIDSDMSVDTNTTDTTQDALTEETVTVNVAEKLTVIEGNSSDRVQEVEYDLTDESDAAKVLGYVSMSMAEYTCNNKKEKPNGDAEQTLKYEGTDYIVELTYTGEAGIPEGTALEVRELEKGTEEYSDYLSRTKDTLLDKYMVDSSSLDLPFARFFDLSLTDPDGNRIEPKSSVSVKIRCTDSLELEDGQQPEVVHFSTAASKPGDAGSVDSSKDRIDLVAELESDNRSDGSTETPEIVSVVLDSDGAFGFKQSSFSVTGIVLAEKSGTAEGIDEAEPEHRKYIKYNREDNNYDLTLTVSGNESNKELDVIFVLDVSGSMDDKIITETNWWGESTREKKYLVANSAIEAFAKKLNERSARDITYSLVTFSSKGDNWQGGDEDGRNTAYRKDAAYNDADIRWIGYKKLGTLATKAEGGTNYQAGLQKAQEVLETLNKDRPNSKKAVVFVTDGNPTFRYNSSGMTVGTGNSDKNGRNMEAAKTELTKMGMNYFFTIGIGEDTEDYSNLVNIYGGSDHAVLAEGVNSGIPSGSNFSGWNFVGNNADSLKTAFDTVAEYLRVVRVKNVTITDTLSENAELVDTGVPPTIVVYNKNGTEVDRSTAGYLTLEGRRIEARCSSDGRQIILDFDDEYELNPDYTYTVTAKIKASDKAVAKYIRDGLAEAAYTDTGDPDTDAEGNNTSSEKKGFFSNNKNTTKVTWNFTNDTTEYSAVYPQPVIQVKYGGPELPETGGSGTALLYILGTALALSAGTLLVYIEKRQRKGGVK